MVSQQRHGYSMSASRSPDNGSGPRLGIIAAFAWEVRPLLRIGRAQRCGHTPFRVRALGLAEKPMLLVIAGAGAANSFAASQYLTRSFPLSGLASIGFAAGLAPGIAAAEVIRGDSVIDAATGERYECDGNLAKARCDRHGNLLSVNSVIRSSEQKLDLGKKWKALAADMEAAGVARAAREAKLPFCALKAITDSAEQSLSIDFSRCQREDGDISVWAVIRQGLATPHGAAELARLAWNARRAAARLAAALQ